MDTVVVVAINLITLIFGSGAFYAAVNTRLKKIEEELDQQKNFAERLAKIETSLLFIIQKLEK